MSSAPAPHHTGTPARQWPGVVVWALAWACMLVLDGHLDMPNLALILVLACALAALWLHQWAAMAASAVAVLAFNFAFVPPRGQLHVDLPQHALLLSTLLAVGWIVSVLMAHQRRLTAAERLQAQRAERLQQLGEALRDADEPRSCCALLRAMLGDVAGLPAALLVAPRNAADPSDMASYEPHGELTADEQAGLWLCLRQTCAMGPGTGRHEEQPAWYLPMRGRHSSLGAALVPLPQAPADADALRAHAQALCDQMALAIERSSATQAAAAAREEAQAQKLRNTLLAAVSHDYRTPLASIMGAASSLHDQAERLSLEQRRRLAATIVDEAEQLARMTANTLQLARLDTPGLVLQRDWESAEEIVGTVLRRVRQRERGHRVHARVESGLPLLYCDSVLLVQLLENLVDNALKHGDPTAPVEVVVRRIGTQVALAVRDRGPGVDPLWRERIFDVFQRGEALTGATPSGDSPARRGAGVGLAVCRTIARAHGGEMSLRIRNHGGSSFECLLPVEVD